MFSYVIFSLLGSVFAQFTNNENTTTATTTTVTNEIVYVNPLSERTKIIICILAISCTAFIPTLVFLACLKKCMIEEERVVLPIYQENEYYNGNRVNIHLRQPEGVPPRYRPESEF